MIRMSYSTRYRHWWQSVVPMIVRWNVLVVVWVPLVAVAVFLAAGTRRSWICMDSRVCTIWRHRICDISGVCMLSWEASIPLVQVVRALAPLLPLAKAIGSCIRPAVVSRSCYLQLSNGSSIGAWSATDTSSTVAGTVPPSPASSSWMHHNL